MFDENINSDGLVRDEISEEQLKMISGGTEAQIFATLSSMVSEVMKNFGAALQTAARS